MKEWNEASKPFLYCNGYKNGFRIWFYPTPSNLATAELLAANLLNAGYAKVTLFSEKSEVKDAIVVQAFMPDDWTRPIKSSEYEWSKRIKSVIQQFLNFEIDMYDLFSDLPKAA